MMAHRTQVEDRPTVLLLRRDPVTGTWAHQRPRRRWVGGFATPQAAIAGAQALGIMRPYVLQFASGRPASAPGE